MASNRSRVIRSQAPRRKGGLHVGRLLALIALAVVAVLLVGGVAWGAYAWITRPAAITVTAEPKDARIVIAGTSAGKARTWEGTGTLTISPATAGGNYLVTVSGTGYAPVKPFAVKPAAGEQIDKTVKLTVLPVALELSVRPETAAWTITPVDGGGSAVSGTGSTTKKVTPGKYAIAVTAPGSTAYKKELTIEPGKSVTFTAWLDPSGQMVHKIMVFDTVPAPKGVAITPDNKEVWVTALVTQPSIGIYDPYTGKQLGGMDLGKNGGVEVIFNKSGTKAYVSQMQSASVFEIDVKARKVLRQLMTKSVWTKVIELSPDEKTLYAANWVGNDVSIIDLKTGKLVKNVPTVQTPRGLYPTPDGKRLFVAGFGEKDFKGRLAVIDMKTMKSSTFFTQQHGAMRHMVADPETNRLYTSDMGQSVVWVTDMTTLKTKLLTRVDSHPNTIALSPDGKILFVSCRGANNPQGYNNKGPEWGTILLFDAATGRPLDAIIAGNQSTALALSDDGKLLVGSDFLDNKARSYEIPPSDVLLAGTGGLYPNHKSLLVRPGWENRWTVGSDVHRVGAAAGDPGTAAN
jgi:YVTN family beta-propeller protein